MASLHIKDAGTADRVTRAAQGLGTSKTEVVRRAMTALEKALLAVSGGGSTPRERLQAWQTAHPLGEPTGLEADKAFYDSLYEDDNDNLR